MFTLTCKKCGHKWIPRVEKPKACPNCNRRAWEEETDASAMDLSPYGADTVLKSISERDLEPQDDGQYSRGEKNDRHRGSDKSPEFRAEIKP